MSDIYKKINKLSLEKQEISKFKSYLIKDNETREQLCLALKSCKTEEEKQVILQDLLRNLACGMLSNNFINTCR